LEEDFLESLPAGVRQQTSNVFKQEELRLKLPSKADDFIEKNRTISRKTQAFTCRRKVLTGKACGDYIHLSRFPHQLPNVLMHRNPRPVLGNHIPCKRLNVTEANGFKPSD